MNVWFILLIICLFLFVRISREPFRNLPKIEPSHVRDAYYVNKCHKVDCVPRCWDKKTDHCMACLQNKFDPDCVASDKTTCEECPYCVWDYAEKECINRPLGVIADEYDRDPYRAAFEINRPWNLDFC
jgi:hypothetical protein